MFPFDVDDEEILEKEAEKETIPVDYEIDFSTGKLTGKKIEKVEAIKQWIKLALGTDRYVFTQYSWDYGSDLNTLIGKNLEKDFIESEAKRMIEEALTVSDDILAIEDFYCESDGDKLTARFRVVTAYGEVIVDV